MRHALSPKQQANVDKMKKFKLNHDLQCQQCKIKKPESKGRYVPYNNGLNQKWICYECSPE